MTVIRVALTELKRLTGGKLPKLVLALMCVIPLLYSGIYMYGNWDPYNKLNDVKGALVMLDTGATKDDGTQMNSGQDIKDELLEKDNFDWNEVSSKDEAVQGVTDGKYDFALIIDPDFSKNLLTSSAFKPDENGNTGTIDPQQAGLEIVTNDANNYVLTNIVKNAGTTIRDNVSSQVGDETANQMLASFTTIHGKMSEAADGASQLADGSGQLKDGVGTLKEGTVKLSDGTVTLADGTQTLLDGSNQLVDGQQQLSDGANDLNTGAHDLANGATSANDGAQKLSSGAGDLADGAQSANDGAQKLSSGASDLADGAASANDGAQKLSSGASDLADGAQSANDGAQKLSSGASDLADGAASADDGAQKLASGATTLNEKMGQAAVGANDLATGANTLKDGASTLKDGSQSLADGAGALASGTKTLSDGADKVSDGANTLSDGASKLADGTAALNDSVKNSNLPKLAEGLQQVCTDLSKQNTSAPSGDFGTDLSNTVVSDIAAKTKNDLAPLVAAGTLTQEQADQIVATIGSDETKSLVAQRNDEALTRLRDGALSGNAGTAAADLAAMSEQMKGLKSSSCATTGESTVSDQLTTLFAAISSVKDGAQQVSGGAASLKDGAASVAQGAQSVEDNTAKLSDGATKVNDGVGSLKTGAEALAAGATKLAGGTTQLADGTKTLADGSTALADGTSQLADGSTTLADGSKTLADGTSKLADGLTTLADGSKSLADGTSQLQDGAFTLADGSNTLADGTAKLADGSNTLADGTQTLADGEAEALDGQKSLADGASQVNDGASDLKDGATQLDNGATDLQNGTNDLKDGADQLATGLTDGTKQIPNLSESDQNKVAENMSNPVNLNHVSLANGSNYGEGMGPYFMVLSLWVGMLMLVQTLRPMNTRALASNAPSLRVILGSWAPFALIGIVQATLVYAIVAGALGFNFVHPILAFFFLCFVSLVYSGIIHGLVIFFGSPGKAVALVLLIIQLVTSGGTMPYETLPNSIRWLHNILPMGYALSGIRRIAYGIDLGGIMPQLEVLLLWLVVGLMLGLVGTIRNRVWNLKALNPEIIV